MKRREGEKASEVRAKRSAELQQEKLQAANEADDLLAALEANAHGEGDRLYNW